MACATRRASTNLTVVSSFSPLPPLNRFDAVCRTVVSFFSVWRHGLHCRSSLVRFRNYFVERFISQRSRVEVAPHFSGQGVLATFPAFLLGDPLPTEEEQKAHVRTGMKDRRRCVRNLFHLERILEPPGAYRRKKLNGAPVRSTTLTVSTPPIPFPK